MKRQLFTCSAALALILFGGSRLRAQDTGCTLSTLKGDYATRISGQVFNSSGAVVAQRDGVAMAHYDGAGGLTQVDFIFANGQLTPGQADPSTGFHTNETGTYTVNSDCTGSATINFPAPPTPGLSGAVIQVMFVLANHGRTLHGIVSSLTPPGPTGQQKAVPANIHADAEKLGTVGEQ